MRARSALFTLFGDVVRPTGGEAWLAALTDAMGALGFTPQATRTALHRMTSEGWVEPRRVGRFAAYRLTARGVDRLEEAAGRIYRLRAAPWDGCWRLLVLRGERALEAEGARSRRNGNGWASELPRALRWMGFGRLAAGVWASPHDHGDRLAALLDRHGASGDAFAFVARSEALGADDHRIVAEAWDPSALRAAHADFLARWTAPAPDGYADDRAAFVDRILLVHHWRSFLFLDPGLPAPLLPSDWLGDDAAARFRDRYEAASPGAWAWWQQRQAAVPAATPAADPDPSRSPFARGLDALDSRSA